jgi:LSD1 subclass zinc finger protein
MHTTPAVPYITTEWVSATKTRNYVLGDPLIDWLNRFGASKGFIPDEKSPGYDPRLDFGKYIMSQGIAFEARIMEQLREKFKPGSELIEIKSISYSTRMKETLAAIQSKTPIIAQGMVFETNLKFHGLPDLLVRGDYLNRLVEMPLPKDVQIHPHLHYVVDIKFSTLHFRADFTHLLNQGSVKAYKAQLYVYTCAIAHMTGTFTGKAFLLGRGWDVTKKGTIYTSPSPFSKLGVVDFAEVDRDSAEATLQAIQWWRILGTHGASWTVLPIPSVPELYPNMSSDQDGGWSSAKKMIASSLKEITLLWQCGQTTREHAHAQAVRTWDDPECSAESLGIQGPKMAPMVDRIIGVNRGQVGRKSGVYPDRIKSTMYAWRERARHEFFIDFESVTSIHSLEDNSMNMIYLVGVGRTEDEKWNFRHFVADGLTLDQEARIVREFLTYLGDAVSPLIECPGCKTKIDGMSGSSHLDCACCWRCCPVAGWYDGNAQCSCEDVGSSSPEPIKLYHYSSAEATFLGKALERIKFTNSGADVRLAAVRDRLQLCDLFKLIKEEPVIIRGALDFSLKSLVGALHSQGKITVSYAEGGVQNGTQSLLAAIVAQGQRDVPFQEHELMKSVIIYNSKDCLALQEILEYLRKNH